MITVDTETRQTIEYLVRELSRFEQDKAIREGLRGAAKVFENFGLANLAVRYKGTGTGLIFQAFRTVVSYGSGRIKTPYSATGLKWPEGYTAHWLDRGTKPRYTKTDAYRGYVTPTYFFVDARQEGERPAMEAIIEGVERAIERINSRR